MNLNKQHPLYQEDLKAILSIDGIEKLKGKRILITGATGLIGVQLIDALMLLGDVFVYAVGRSRSKAISRLGEYFDLKNFIFVEQDVRDPFPEDIKVDYIIPLASNTHPLAYSQYPIETILINTLGAQHALNLAQQCDAVLLYPSSVEIYGNAFGQEVFTEDYTGKLNLSNSRSCYTESKRLCEALCQSYAAEQDVKVIIGRLSRIIGPTMLESDTKASSQFLKKAMAREDIVLKSEGNQFYSYIYVADAVAAVLYLILHGEYGKQYNISNSSCNIHLRDFAQLCAQCVGKQVVFDLPTEIERKGFSIAMTAILDSTRLLELGFKPHFEMKNAISRTIDILS